MSPPSLPPPSPERDRALARKPRYGYRNAVPLAAEIDALMSSEDAKRLRRFQRVAGALKSALSATHIARIKPVQLKGGALTIDVADGPLLAELRQHHAQAVLNALATAGTGVSRVVWRLARSSARRS